MDWFEAAQNDWEVYHDPSRIRLFVEFGKITSDQFTDITNEPY